MADKSSDSIAERSQARESYNLGYPQEVLGFFSQRSAEHQAAFLLPYLRHGMRLLDCGCGPGSITTDLAGRVAPGEVVGVDVDSTQVEIARSRAVRLGVGDVRFEVASVHELPFADEAFDAALSHGVVEHLSEPVAALSEIRRVLKPGGILGVRHADLGGHLFAPEDPLCEEFFRLYALVSRAGGGDPSFGRHQVAALLAAGFTRLAPSASYDCWTETPETTARAAAAMSALLTSSPLAERAIELGLANRAALEASAEAFRQWSGNPAAFAAEAWCEAVAWKD